MTTVSKSSNSSVLDRLYGYPEDVLAGRIFTSHKVRLACERFRRELDRSKHDPDYPWVFDEHKAARPSVFMERFLRPTKGNYPGMVLMPWQCSVEGNMYGWVDKKTGLRRFRESLIVEGRGNGKTTLIAGNVTYMACKDGERGADIYLLANAKEQAKICYEEAYKQIKASPTLRGRFRLTREGIFYEAANATIKARASDSSNLDGLNPHLAVFDEIHELTADGFKLIDVIRQGMLKRDQPLTIYITTMDNGIIAGINENSSLIESAARSAAQAAYNAAKNELGIASPSKKGGWLGEMFDLGFAGGLRDNADEIRDAMGYLNDLAVAEAEPVVVGGSSQRGMSGFELDYGRVRDAFIEAIEETGVGNMVMFMDKEVVGQTVEPATSRATRQRQQQTVKGRTARLVMG